MSSRPPFEAEERRRAVEASSAPADRTARSAVRDFRALVVSFPWREDPTASCASPLQILLATLDQRDAVSANSSILGEMVVSPGWRSAAGRLMSRNNKPDDASKAPPITENVTRTPQRSARIPARRL